MEQIAVVKAVLNNGMAEVTVERETACGAAHSCSECAGCEKMMTRTQNVVTAYNDAQAGPGDLVKLRSENAAFFKTAAIASPLPLPWAGRGRNCSSGPWALCWGFSWPSSGTGT